VDEMIELIRHHLRDPERSRAMARKARAHCVEEHQWKHRFETVLRALDVLEGGADDPWLS
jgi:hypothetical protein